MNLQDLKLKRTLPHLHTGSDLLATGGYLLRKATDPHRHPVGVADERQRSSVFAVAKILKSICTWTSSPIQKKIYM